MQAVQLLARHGDPTLAAEAKDAAAAIAVLSARAKAL
jgi:hypothetical protein